MAKEEVPPAQQAQRIKKEDVSGGAAADPRSVLVSNLGNGSGGSQPSTDQGSWTQVCTLAINYTIAIILGKESWTLDNCLSQHYSCLFWRCE